MLKKLTTASFEKAKRFLETEARTLEWRLFQYHFEDTERARRDVLEELKRYQNSDGGFGHALEPDVRMKGSSVVATKFALQILLDLDAPKEEPFVRDGIAYLLDAYDSDKGVWPLVPGTVMDAPHAPWWNVEGLEEEFGSYLANPKAGVLRCLLEYPEGVTGELIRDVTDSVMAHFHDLPIEMPFFDAISYLMLLQAQNLSDRYNEELQAKLEKTAKEIVSQNPEKWTEFAIKPLWLAPAPHAPLAAVLWDAAQENLDFEIDHQNEDGSWSPLWSWGDADPENWKMAEREWKGVLTLAMLRTLRDYGRIQAHPPVMAGYKYHID